ncbi:MAG: phosphoenolpyruvate--protein phosphotransferase [Candidatus Omnitrophica bacterium]|nr:phosphoenolpyruvate--protein phosphotransferase [Candidatus Omnitrophota bacterium]
MSQLGKPIRRDHTKLLCDIGELSGLFRDTTSLEAFLQKIVEMTAEHMHAEVCSIYLYYEEQEALVLKATKGLKPEAIGKVKLKLGEGLTGVAVKEMRPICVQNASLAPNYRYFPEIGEEAYESFLVVPIMRGNIRIGAIVIQNSKKDAFNEDDVHALRALTAQLANTIETAKVLMTLKEKQPAVEPLLSKIQGMVLIKGKVGSHGLAHGQASVYEHAHSFSKLKEYFSPKTFTIQDFYTALNVTEKQLNELEKYVENKLSDDTAIIFTAQTLMLKDKDFIDTIVEKIQGGTNASYAICQTLETYIEKLANLPDYYLRERQQDVMDVGKRLLSNLLGIADSEHDCQNHIVIAQDLYPSDILKLSSHGIHGLILLSGGITSHLSILARSLEIPLVIADDPRLLKLPSEIEILLDAEQGSIYINPTEDVVRSFKNQENAKVKIEHLGDIVKEETRTADGVRVKLLANINLLSELPTAHQVKAEGVGLYRTEFPFMVRSSFPSEEEQFSIYQKLIQGMGHKEVTLRTLDIGGDKILSYYDYGKEENPFLGMRSIRFSLLHQDVFCEQLRAILRAGVGADLKIMFPMISSVDEFLEAKEIVAKCMEELKRDGLQYHLYPKIGMMVELPAVIEIIDELAHLADFFSIGTNDFIQYMLAVDRTNEKVAHLYLPHHPSVLRALKKVVDAASRYHKEVTICGDMAHEEKYLPYFLGIGLRQFSLDPHVIPAIQQAIEKIHLKEAVQSTEKLLSQNRIKEINQLIS